VCGQQVFAKSPKLIGSYASYEKDITANFGGIFDIAIVHHASKGFCSVELNLYNGKERIKCEATRTHFGNLVTSLVKLIRTETEG
jgi:hypothetical protein